MPANLPDPAAIIDRLEKILRASDALIIPLWYDRHDKLFWAGEHTGDTLREALLKLVTEGDRA